jgi:predicted dehydrogenase
MDPNPLRVALIGYGLAGAVFHAPLIAAVPGLELAAVVTTNEERRARAAREHPDARLLDTVEQIWSAAQRYDVAVVAAPNRLHVPLALASVEAGLPVVVDKPLAPTGDQGRELVEAARARGVLLTVFQNRRWDGDFLTVRRVIDEGRLGRVLRFESSFERWRPELSGSWRERADPAEGGGLLLDLGSHLVDQALRLFGPVEDVYAEVDVRRAGAADDDVFVALEHSSGVYSHLRTAAIAALQGPRFRVLGDHAAYVKYGLDVQEDALRAGAHPGDPGWGEEPQERWGVVGAGGETDFVPTERGRYEVFYERLVAALREGAPAPVDPREAVEALEVLDAARRSSR